MKNLAFLFAVFSLAACHQTQEKSKSTAMLISNVNIIDVTNGTLLKNYYVVIDSGKIKSVSQNLDKAKECGLKIDGTDKYLMPGLAEMHAHIPQPPTSSERVEDVLFLYVSNGVTTIRGMLGHPSHLELRKKAKSGEILSPRIFTSSPSLNGSSVQSKEEAKQKVTAYQKEGYDFLKIHPGIQLEVFDQIVETANAVSIPFAGHVPVDVGIRHALKSQYASIDHVDGFLEGLVPESANVPPDQNGFFGYNFTPLANIENISELVKLAKENSVWIVPTQSLFTKWFAPTGAEKMLDLPEMKYMPKETLDNWRQRKEQSTGKGSGFNKAQWEKFDDIRKKLIKELSDNGHGMLLGSDAPQLFNVPGFSIHKEIDDMSQAGMTNLQILQSGTINPAIFFGMEDTFGQIKIGFDADLILLDADPLENLNALREISGVVLQGNWIARESIQKRLDSIADKL